MSDNQVNTRNGKGPTRIDKTNVLVDAEIAKMLNGVDPSLLRLPGFLNKDWLVRYKKLSDKIYTLKELQSVF